MHIIFDIEVFKHDWIVVYRAVEQDKYYVVHNDNDKVKYFMDRHRDDVFFTFNGSHYDKYILKAIMNDASNEMVKNINDFIIVDGKDGWQHPFLKHCQGGFFWHSDLTNDMQKGLSLKSIEGHLGMNIEETEVDFNLDRPLTEEELELTIRYCKFDVDATCELYKLRQGYLDNKVMVGNLSGLNEKRSLGMTNAKLTAKYLKAVRVKTDDERVYEYPDNLLKEYIPQEIFDYFDRRNDKSISDIDLFTTKYYGSIGRASYTVGFGGIHGDVKNIAYEENDDYAILNMDVGSYYPHLITINHYVSRAIANPDDYALMLERRMKAKRDGDKVTNLSLKLVCNSTYGAFGDVYNDLYDPRMMRSVCISGQLYLLELAYHCTEECDCEIIQLNTDGIMIYCARKDLAKVEEIFNEWQQRTGFELERDDIKCIYQKDVNDYIEIKNDGSFKIKGGWLVRGIAKAGAWNINNNACIVAKAITDYLVNGISPEQTILSCDDPLQYFLIAKSSGKYERVYQLINDTEVEVQKCNRVYATKDASYGTLYQVKKENGQISKIAGLPDHCIVDNKNEIDISQIDKKWYIALAWERIPKFIGE